MYIDMLNSIHWPIHFLPGYTDNFVSNEIIISGKKALDIWPYLSDAMLWPSYYSNASNVDLNGQNCLSLGLKFSFETFGFLVQAQVKEYLAPSDEEPGRIAWHGWSGEENTVDRLDVHHAWLIENLSENRVRILTQETQLGSPAKVLAQQKPNPMLNGHQDWLDGLAQVLV